MNFSNLMYAIVNIAGKQMKVQPNDLLCTPKLNSRADKVVFDQVLYMEADGKMVVGTPTIPNTQVVAKVIGDLKTKKIIVFKKKRRKGYKTKQGHRQQYTKICIEKIITS